MADVFFTQNGWEWHYDNTDAASKAILIGVNRIGTANRNVAFPTDAQWVAATGVSLLTVAADCFYDSEGEKLYSITSMPATVTTIGNQAFRNCHHMTSCVIGVGVTSIGDDAFRECAALTSITIPDNVITAGARAFQACTSMSTATVGNGIIILEDQVFDSCTAMTAISIGTSVNSIHYRAINYCLSLLSITFQGLIKPVIVDSDWILNSPAGVRGHSWPTSNFPTPGGVFYGLTMGAQLEAEYTYTVSGASATITGYIGVSSSIFIPATMGGIYTTYAIGNDAFNNVKGHALTSIIIPSSVVSIGNSAFRGCTLLTSMTIPNTVYSLGSYAFYGCIGLEYVTISNNITVIYDYTFFGCISLRPVTIGNNVTSIGNFAFCNCGSMNTISLGSNVTIIGNNAFYSCVALTSITIGNNVTSIGNNAFYGCVALTSAVIGSAVTSIGDYAFNGCTNLTSVTIGNAVTSIGVSAFNGCIKLAAVTIPNNVVTINTSAFNGCSLLASVTFTATSHVTTIGSSSFHDCVKLSAITLPDSVTTVGNNAFEGCSIMSSVALGVGVTSIGISCFQDCAALTWITFKKLTPTITVEASWISGTNASIKGHAYNASSFPAPGSYFPATEPHAIDRLTMGATIEGWSWTQSGGYATVTSYNGATSSPTIPSTFGASLYPTIAIANGAFNNVDAHAIISLVIPNSVTTIGEYAFAGCVFMSSVNIPIGVTIINQYTFYQCHSLISINIPDGVTSIGVAAFRECNILPSVIIPSTTISIGADAFRDDTLLTSISFYGLVAGDITVGSNWILNTSGSIRGHASESSDFPIAPNTWNGLIMGDFILEIAVDELSAEAGRYGSTSYIKLTWPFPEMIGGYTIDTIWYEIFRESLSTPGTWESLGTNHGRNNVFFDSAMSVEESVSSNPLMELMMEPNTEYTYKVRVVTSGGTFPAYTPTASARSPNFPKNISSGTGPNGWSLTCGLDIYDGDDSGRPTIHAFGISVPVVANPVLEMAQYNGDWIKIADITRVVSLYTEIITPANSPIDFNTSYKIRMTSRDVDGNLINYTNEVVVTTYSLGPDSFPNMLPNAGLQYGFYDDILHGPYQPISKIDTAVGTYERYGISYIISPIDAEDVSIIVNTPTIISLLPTGAATLDLYSKKALKLIKEFDGDVDNQAYTMNLSAYNFPGHPLFPLGINRQYGFSCRLIEKLNPAPVAFYSNGCKAEISRKIGDGISEVPDTYTYETLISSEDASSSRIIVGPMNTLAGVAGEHGQLISSVFWEPPNTLERNGHHHQSQLIFQAKNYNIAGSVFEYSLPSVCEIYIGDMMLFDLSNVFDGNRGDIVPIAITNDRLQKLMNAIDNWWDFDYVSNTPDIPYDISAVVVSGTVVTCELYNVEDDNGGMDTSGYLPTDNYLIRYTKVGNNFYEESGPFIVNLQPTPRTLGSEDPLSDYRLDPGSMYDLTYLYTNSGGNSGFSKSVGIETAPYPDQVRNVEMNRYWSWNDGTQRTYFTINWDMVNEVAAEFLPEHKILGYKVQLGTDGTNWSRDIIVGSDRTTTTTEVYYYHDVNGSDVDLKPHLSDYNSLVYFCKVRAYNLEGDGVPSDVISSVGVSLPSMPQNTSYTFFSPTDETTRVMYTWDAPEDDGCTETGTEGITEYVIMHGTDAANLQGPLTVGGTWYQPTVGEDDYTLTRGETSYFKVAAITYYTGSVATHLGGLYSNIRKVTFVTHTEIITVRGTATNEGYIDFYFTARTDDGSYVQLDDGETHPKDAFWRLTSRTAPISAYSNIHTIKSLIDEENATPGTNVFRNGIVAAGSGYSPGWPLWGTGDGPVYRDTVLNITVDTAIVNDIFGEALRLTFTMNTYQGYAWDVQASTAPTIDSPTSVGLNGLGVFLIITDYTTDISFYDYIDRTLTKADADFMVGNIGSLIWTINSSVVYNQYANQNEKVPLTSQDFFIPIRPEEELIDIGGDVTSIEYIINNGIGDVPSLQTQLNSYFLGTEGVINPAIRSIYEAADSVAPFVVSTTTSTLSISDGLPDGKTHLRVNIKTMVEGIQNQITCRTANMQAFYLATKANTCYVNDMMYELRSFNDMYGRNKPGSSVVSSGGYVKRSYGFKFNLDYIKEYKEDENSSIDSTPIPGMSSSNTIGLDVIGTTRMITITGVRVDNSNYWMFHAPYSTYDEFTGLPVESGVIYMGTSNWGWCKFMKAVMGTFQFMDGPYRLIMMTVPSSMMQQYVPDRLCKYQYPDGTYMVQAGTEDMCYVMIERFSTTKDEEMYNAISYELALRRVAALGSST